MERSVLITNLLDVSIETGLGHVTTHTNALMLLDQGAKSSGPRYRVYGYHNEAANPTFSLMLPSFEWAIDPQEYRRSFALCIDGAPRMMLTTDFANELPLDIKCFEGEIACRGWGDMLMRKVLRYYNAPYFILGQQFETERTRKALGVEGVVEV